MCGFWCPFDTRSTFKILIFSPFLPKTEPYNKVNLHFYCDINSIESGKLLWEKGGRALSLKMNEIYAVHAAARGCVVTKVSFNMILWWASSKLETFSFFGKWWTFLRLSFVLCVIFMLSLSFCVYLSSNDHVKCPFSCKEGTCHMHNNKCMSWS